MPNPWEKYQSDSKPQSKFDIKPATTGEETSGKPWDKYGVEKKPKEFGEMSPFQSSVSGLAQDLTGGYADEIAGHMRAAPLKAFDKVRSLVTGEPEQEKPYWGENGLYREKQKEQERYTKQANEDNPKTYLGSQLAGDVILSASPIGKAIGPTKGAGLIKNIGKMAAMGAVYGSGSSEGTLDNQGDQNKLLQDTLIGGAIGGATQGVLQKAGDVAAKFSPKNLRIFAEKAAKNATGATGKQVENFGDDAGRMLLDNKIVQFGSNQEDIAKRAADKLNESGGKIGDSLSKLDEMGGEIPQEEIIRRLAEKVSALKGDPSKSSQVRQLKTIMEDVAAGNESHSLSGAEGVKKGFQDDINYMTEKSTYDAKKAAASAYRQAVEDEALRLDPNLAETFKKNKEIYGAVAPVQEYAQRRANTTNQSPWGGLLDTAAFGAGAAGLGYAGGDGPLDTGLAGLAGMVGRRFVAPRASSSTAVIADKLANTIEKAPQSLKKTSEILYNAARSGVLPQSIARRIIDEYERENQ